MRPYEIMVIFDVDLEEGAVQERIDRVLELVKGRGGTAGEVHRWGRREFAYPVQRRTEGYYVVVEVTAEPEVLKETDRMLALDDAVLRHKVIRQDPKMAGRSEVRSGPRQAPVEADEAAAG